MSLHGGKLAAKALKEAGVEVVFTLSGGHIMPLYDGCIDEGIKIVDVRHEQAAVHAADSWARCNPGSIGVAAITAGIADLAGVDSAADASFWSEVASTIPAARLQTQITTGQFSLEV